MKEIIDNFCWEEHKKVITFEHHGIQGLKNIAYWNLSTAAPPTPKHFHSDIIEIHCLLKGKRVCHVGTQTYTVTGNEMFLTFPYEEHFTSNYQVSPCTFFGLQLDLKDKNQLLGLNEEYSRALYELLSTCPYRHLRFSPAETQLLKQAFNNISDGDEHTKMLGVQYLACFLFKIQEFTPVKEEHKTIIDKNIQRVLAYIEQVPHQTINLKDLAAISGFSLSRFKSKFKDEVGLPPANYITLKKVEFAKNLLSTTDLSVTQIALDAGFASSNYFYTIMRNYTSYSPSEYRSICRQNANSAK